MSLAGGLVLAFGSVALRRQRKQLELERELALAQVVQKRDERLVRAGRAATMGTFAMGVAHEISTPLAVMAMAILAEFPGARPLAVLMSSDGKPYADLEQPGAL